MEQLNFYVIMCHELVENNLLSRREAINMVADMPSFKKADLTLDDLTRAMATQTGAAR